MNLPTLLLLTFACLGSTIYFVSVIVMMAEDWDSAYAEFKQRYYKIRDEQESLGESVMRSSFRQYVIGYYVSAAFFGYGFYHFLTKIFERLL